MHGINISGWLKNPMRSYIKIRYVAKDYGTAVKIKCAMPPVNGSEFSGLKIRHY